MSYGYRNVDFKPGGDATASAEGQQANIDPTTMINAGTDVGVANPDIFSDKDFTQQGQQVGAGALGGTGGSDNVYQNIVV
ncbi:MAG: hypothetical protein ACFCVA_00540 [Gammaproteobacteria bacterium]